MKKKLFNYGLTILGLITIQFATSEVAYAALDTNLEGYWRFDGNGNDSSGHGRDLTLFGGVGFASGVNGQALDFHGDYNQYAQRPVNDTVFDLASGDFTVQFWFNLNDNTKIQSMVEKFSGANGPGWSISYLTYGGGYEMYPYPVSGALNIDTNTWHQFLETRNGNTVSLYVDGVLGTQTQYAGSISTTTDPLLVGHRNEGDGRGFAVDGRIDDLAIWSRGVSAQEASSLYNGGQSLNIAAVPEPTSGAMLFAGLGLIGLVSRRRNSGKLL